MKMEKINEIKQFVENMDPSSAHYCYGYLKGFHNIKEKEEPKKTLWEIRHGHLGEELYIDEVKEALKEFIDWINDDELQDNIYTIKAKEIFGKELLK